MWASVGLVSLGYSGRGSSTSQHIRKKKIPLPIQVASAGPWSRELLETAVAGSG